MKLPPPATELPVLSTLDRPLKAVTFWFLKSPLDPLLNPPFGWILVSYLQTVSKTTLQDDLTTRFVTFSTSDIHAREWITSAVSTYLINEILNGTNPAVRSWVNDYDFYILPVMNPDGLVFTKTTVRD